MITFTPEHPCRCGFAGTGTHRCHAGRPDPATGEDGSRWCTQLGNTRLIPTGGSLAGMQLKFSCTTGCYCSEHWAEAGFTPAPAQ